MKNDNIFLYLYLHLIFFISSFKFLPKCKFCNYYYHKMVMSFFLITSYEQIF